MRLTLDTSFVVAAHVREPEHDLVAIDRIVGLGWSGDVELWLTEAHDRDLSRNKDEESRQQRLEWLQSRPIVPRRLGGPFRLDVGRLDSEDALASAHLLDIDASLKAILRINAQAGTRPDKIYSDIDHLLAHRDSGNDAFVTVDCRTVLRFQEELGKLGITVLAPQEAVDLALGRTSL